MDKQQIFAEFEKFLSELPDEGEWSQRISVSMDDSNVWGTNFRFTVSVSNKQALEDFD